MFKTTNLKTLVDATKEAVIQIWAWKRTSSSTKFVGYFRNYESEALSHIYGSYLDGMKASN